MVAGSHGGPKLSACLLEVILIFCVSVEGWGLVWCRLALVPMRGLGLSGLGGWWGGGGLWAVCVQGREPDAHVSRLPMIILLGGYSGTLLVVSILDIVHDSHL